MSFYESVFIARQDIPATQVEALSAEFADLIRAQGGEVTKTEQWGLRNLAYKINKNRKGHYVLFNLNASPAAVAEMERNMRLHEDILRFMTVRVDELEAGPSAIMRRDERSERDGERGADRGGDRGDRPQRSFGDRGDRGGSDRGSSDRPARAPRRDQTAQEGA